MTNKSRISGDLAEHIAAVTNKRARFILDTIAKKESSRPKRSVRQGMSIRLALFETHGRLDFPSGPSRLSTRMGEPLRRMFSLRMRALNAAKADDEPSRRNRGMELLMRQEEGVRFVEGTRTCRLTTAFPMRLPASLMETMRRSSWFCAGHAIARNHGVRALPKLDRQAQCRRLRNLLLGGTK